ECNLAGACPVPHCCAATITCAEHAVTSATSNPRSADSGSETRARAPLVGSYKGWILGMWLVQVAFPVWMVIGLPGSYDGNPNRQDSYQYDSLGWNLVQGFGFAVNRGSVLVFGNCPPCEPVTYPLPGYPAFLAVIYAIFGRDYLVVKLIQAAVDTGTCLLAY